MRFGGLVFVAGYAVQNAGHIAPNPEKRDKIGGCQIG